MAHSIARKLQYASLPTPSTFAVPSSRKTGFTFLLIIPEYYLTSISSYLFILFSIIHFLMISSLSTRPDFPNYQHKPLTFTQTIPLVPCGLVFFLLTTFLTTVILAVFITATFLTIIWYSQLVTFLTLTVVFITSNFPHLTVVFITSIFLTNITVAVFIVSIVFFLKATPGNHGMQYSITIVGGVEPHHPPCCHHQMAQVSNGRVASDKPPYQQPLCSGCYTHDRHFRASMLRLHTVRRRVLLVLAEAYLFNYCTGFQRPNTGIALELCGCEHRLRHLPEVPYEVQALPPRLPSHHYTSGLPVRRPIQELIRIPEVVEARIVVEGAVVAVRA